MLECWRTDLKVTDNDMRYRNRAAELYILTYTAGSSKGAWEGQKEPWKILDSSIPVQLLLTTSKIYFFPCIQMHVSPKSKEW